MKKNLNKMISFYKNYYKELDVKTIKNSKFNILLEFDIVIRFNIKPTKEELNHIIEAIQGV